MGQKNLCEFESGLGNSTAGNSLCQPSSKWVHVLIKGSIMQLMDRDDPFFHMLQPSNPTVLWLQN